LAPQDYLSAIVLFAKEMAMNTIGLMMMAWFALLVGCMSAVALSNDRLPQKYIPLDEIVESLEKAGYVVIEAEADEGRWEVDAHKGDETYELHIDPATGETIAAHRDDAEPTPSARAMKLSKLLKAVNQAGYAGISSVEFKRGKWEVEVRKGRQKYELKVDAENGKILSDRIDD
jgi:uncharacterized membrane protein YkoI